MSEVKFNEEEMELFLLGVQEDNKRTTELEAENNQNRTDLVKVTKMLARERAKVERLREALEEIATYYPDDGIDDTAYYLVLMAKKALGAE